ncbi:MAG: right-handed parallel beta-helix repeat-containing protein [Candidatus Micrarchaeota archaeon]
MRFIAVFILALLLLPSTSFALTNISYCQQIAAPDYYTVNTSLEGRGSASLYCLRITSSDVVIDCNGYSIKNNDSSATTAIYIAASLDNISILNCNISNYSTGIWKDNYANNVQIRNNTLYNMSSTGIRTYTGDNVSIEDNLAYQCYVAGFMLNCGTECYNVTLYRNNVTQCSWHPGYYGAIEVDGSFNGIRIINNTAWNNSDIGIMVATPQTSQGYHNYTYFSGNRMFLNTDGLSLNNGLWGTYEDSEIFNNGFKGIDLHFSDIIVTDLPVRYSNFSNLTLYGNMYNIYNRFNGTSIGFLYDAYNQFDRDVTLDGRPVYYYYNGSTLDGYTGAPASDASYIGVVYTDDKVIENLDMENLNTSIAIYIVESENVTIRNVNVSGYFLKGIYGSYANYTKIDNFRAFNNTNYTSGYARGIEIYHSSYMSINNSWFNRSGQIGINILSPGFLSPAYYNNITNVETYYHDEDGIYVGGAYRCYLGNITAAFNGMDGIHLGGYEDLARDIAAYNNNMAGLAVYSDNTTVRNISAYNNWIGLEIKSNGENNIITNFTTYGNTYGFGIRYQSGFSADTNNTFIDGRSYNNDYGAYINGASNEWVRDIEIYDNVNASLVVSPYQHFTSPSRSSNNTFINVTFRNSQYGALIYTYLPMAAFTYGGPTYFEDCNFSGHSIADISIEQNNSLLVTTSMIENANVSINLTGWHGNLTFNGTDAPAVPGYGTVADMSVNITNLSYPADVYNFTFHWTDAQIASYDELDFVMLHHNGSWEQVPAQTLTPGANQLSAFNITDFSPFGLFQYNTTTCMEINASGTYQLTNNVTGAPIDASEVADLSWACIKIASSDVYFDCNGFYIENNGTADAAGIVINGSATVNYTNVTIANCPGVSYYKRGIYLHYSALDSVNNVVAHSSYGGVGDGFGFVIFGSYHNITNSTAFNNTYSGFSFSSLTHANFINNTAYNNSQYGFGGTASSDYNLFDRNTVYNNSLGFRLDSSSYNNLTDNWAYNHSNDGFALYNGATYNRLISNIAIDNGDGFFLVTDCNYNTYLNNTVFRDTQYGYQLQDSHYNNLTNNTAYNCTSAGFFLFVGSENNTLVDNTAFANLDGFSTSTSSHNNTLINNLAYNNSRRGFTISTNYNTTLIGNTAYNNTQCGLLHYRANASTVINMHLFGNSLGEVCVNSTDYQTSLTFMNLTIDSPDGIMENYTSLDISDSLGTDSGYLIKWTSNSSVLPATRDSFANKFVNITNLNGSNTFDSISWNWLDSEIAGYVEGNFELWKYNASGWAMLNDTPDTVGNMFELSGLDPQSDFGILQFNTSISDCLLIQSPGSYQLVSNLVGASVDASEVFLNKACIKISAQDVTLDCNGYSITNDGTVNSAGVLINGSSFPVVDYPNVIIENCPGVSGYSYGVYAYDVNDTTVRNTTAFNNTYSIANRNNLFPPSESVNITFVDSSAYNSSYCFYGENSAGLNMTNLLAWNCTGAAYAAHGNRINASNVTGWNSTIGFNMLVPPASAVGARNIELLNSEFFGNQYGVSLDGDTGLWMQITDSFIQNVMTHHNERGIHINFTDRIYVTNLTAHSNTILGSNFAAADELYLTDFILYNNSLDMRMDDLLGAYNAYTNITRIYILPPSGIYQNYTNLSIGEDLGVNEEYTLNWSSNASALPANRRSFAEKSVNISVVNGPVSIDNITWNWLSSETGGYVEASFELWKFNSSGWLLMNNTPDITANSLSQSNLNPQSDYAILESNESACMEISASGSYVLNNNLTGAPISAAPQAGTACIKITSSNVLLDCRNYNISNDGTAPVTRGIMAIGGLTNVTVQNCSVNSYSYGVEFYQVDDSVIDNSTAFNNSYGFYIWTNSDRNQIRRSVASSSINHGFFVRTSSAYNNFTNNTAEYAGSIGFYLSDGSNYAIMADNFAYENEYGYTLWSSRSCNISNNVAFKNYMGFDISTGGYGLAFFNTISDNVAYNNSLDGFRIWTNRNNITNNTAYYNLRDGFNFYLSFHNVDNNTAHSNARHGFMMDFATDINMTNNTAWNNSQTGITLRSAENYIMADSRFWNNSMDLYVVSAIGTPYAFNMSNSLFLNPAGTLLNYSNVSINDSVDAGAEYMLNWTSEPAALPADYLSFAGKYVEITDISGGVVIDTVAWHWLDSELTGYNESVFGLWTYNASGWALLNNTPNAAGNELSLLNLNPASAFGILQLNDSNAPQIALNQPANDYLTNLTSISFNFTAVDDHATAMNCSLLINGTYAESAIALNNTLTNIVATLGEGSWNWSINCLDSANNSNTSAGRNFTVDLTAPSLVLGAPENITYNVTNVIPINLTVSADAAACWYDAGAGQVVLPGCANTTATLANGFYNMSISASDAAGNVNSTNATFTVDVPAPPPPSGGGGEEAIARASVDTEVSDDGGLTVTVTYRGLGLEDARVELYMHDPAFEFIATDSTDGGGVAEFTLPSSGVYRIYVYKSGYYFRNPYQVTWQYVPECAVDSDCLDGEYCSEEGACVAVEPGTCGVVADHAWTEYACCADTDCAQGFMCQEHSCVPVPEPDERGPCDEDGDCASTEYCDSGSCRPVPRGACGYVSDHAWFDYECCEDGDCTEGFVCRENICILQEEFTIETDEQGFVGDDHTIRVYRNGEPFSGTVVIITPDGQEYERAAEGDGRVVLPLEVEGEYEVRLLFENAVVDSAEVGSLSKPSVQQDYLPFAFLGELETVCPVAIILLAVIALFYILYKRRKGEAFVSVAAKKKKPN